MEPLWLSVARAFLGLQEKPGAGSNPVILRWASDLKAPDYKDDDEAWCALFVNRLMMGCQLPLSGTGFDLLRAKSFVTWGKEITIPAVGAIMVFSRPEGAHVGLYLGERKDAYSILGGNTGNAVALTWILKNRLIATRWPDAIEHQDTYVAGRVWLTDDGKPVSANEA